MTDSLVEALSLRLVLKLRDALLLMLSDTELLLLKLMLFEALSLNEVLKD
ncbi:hypothetical protein [Lactiplantibacillus plantarum]|nr:hypothetical protein [Lactiplantibacillus plantarum]